MLVIQGVILFLYAIASLSTVVQQNINVGLPAWVVPRIGNVAPALEKSMVYAAGLYVAYDTLQSSRDSEGTSLVAVRGDKLFFKNRPVVRLVPAGRYSSFHIRRSKAFHDPSSFDPVFVPTPVLASIDASRFMATDLIALASLAFSDTEESGEESFDNDDNEEGGEADDNYFMSSTDDGWVSLYTISQLTAAGRRKTEGVCLVDRVADATYDLAQVAVLIGAYDVEITPVDHYEDSRSFEERFNDFEETFLSHFTQLGLPWLILILYFLCDDETYEDEEESEMPVPSNPSGRPNRTAAEWFRERNQAKKPNVSTTTSDNPQTPSKKRRKSKRRRSQHKDCPSTVADNLDSVQTLVTMSKNDTRFSPVQNFWGTPTTARLWELDGSTVNEFMDLGGGTEIVKVEGVRVSDEVEQQSKVDFHGDSGALITPGPKDSLRAGDPIDVEEKNQVNVETGKDPFNVSTSVIADDEGLVVATVDVSNAADDHVAPFVVNEDNAVDRAVSHVSNVEEPSGNAYGCDSGPSIEASGCVVTIEQAPSQCGTGSGSLGSSAALVETYGKATDNSPAPKMKHRRKLAWKRRVIT